MNSYLVRFKSFRYLLSLSKVCLGSPDWILDCIDNITTKVGHSLNIINFLALYPQHQ